MLPGSGDKDLKARSGLESKSGFPIVISNFSCWVSAPESPRNSWIGRRGKPWRGRTQPGLDAERNPWDFPWEPGPGVQGASVSPGSHTERSLWSMFGEVQLQEQQPGVVGGAGVE